MKKFLTVVFAILLTASTAHAEIFACAGEAEYCTPKNNAEFAAYWAQILAEQNLVKKICVHLRANTTLVDDVKISDDDLATQCMMILEITDTTVELANEADSVRAKVFVTGQIDLDELKSRLDGFRKNS